MRFSGVLFACALAATGCQHSKPVGPAWPAASTTADDGGESIDPHLTAVASSIEHSDSDDDDDAVPAAEPVKAAPTAEPTAPTAVTPPTQPPDGDVIMSDEIIIEIDD